MSVGNYGLTVSNSEGTTISGNTANDFLYHGISVSKSQSITITDNTANDNGDEYHDYGGNGFYLSAGGIGGMLGGGLANVGQLVGIPGMEQGQMMQLAAQQALDPESYGSSNSLDARYKAPTMQYV